MIFQSKQASNQAKIPSASPSSLFSLPRASTAPALKDGNGAGRGRGV